MDFSQIGINDKRRYKGNPDEKPSIEHIRVFLEKTSFQILSLSAVRISESDNCFCSSTLIELILVSEIVKLERLT